eukprot:5435211-Amphidinium_carterae.1
MPWLVSGGINRVVYEMLCGCAGTDGKDTAEDADVVNSQYELLPACRSCYRAELQRASKSLR